MTRATGAATGPVARSRRDRKRIATRAALQEAALLQFAERGYAHTTVRDITEAVDVSERTFFRYFATKEDVLLSDLVELRAAMLDALAARPGHEPPLVAILGALAATRSPERSRRLALLPPPTGPAPSGRLLQLFAEWELSLAAVLLTRAGHDPEHPDPGAQLRADVTARAALAALRSAMSRYRALEHAAQADDRTLPTLVVQAFSVLTDGFRR